MLRYAEYRRALRVLWVLVAVLFFIVLAGLIEYGHQSVSYRNFDAWRAALERQPGTTVTIRHDFGDVVTEIISNERRGIRVETTRGSRGYRSIQVTVPTRERKTIGKLLSVVGTAVYYETSGGVSRITNYNASYVQVYYAAGLAMLVGLICATLLGGPAKENDGHLGLVWLRPISRMGYALSAIGIALGAIAVAELATGATVLVSGILVNGNTESIDWATNAWSAPVALLIPISWYALLTSVSASLRRGPALVIGVAWAAAFGLLMLNRESKRAGVFSSAVHAFSWVNPLRYLDVSPPHVTYYVAALAVLTVAYGVLAVVQWRRAEV